MPKRIVKIILITAVLLITFFVALYLVGSNSEPYEVAEAYVSNSEKIKSEFGTVSDVRLAFFGYSVRYSGSSGSASLELVIHSDDKKANVYLDMKKKTGKWEIRQAKLRAQGKGFIELK